MHLVIFFLYVCLVGCKKKVINKLSLKDNYLTASNLNFNPNVGKVV